MAGLREQHGILDGAWGVSSLPYVNELLTKAFCIILQSTARFGNDKWMQTEGARIASC